MRVLGLDPSLTNLGFVILENGALIHKGRLQTAKEQGLNVERYLLQANGVADLILKYNIKYVATESPIFQDFNSEVLYGLQSFLHLIYWALGMKVLIISPLRVKSYALPGFKGKIFKADMVSAAKLDLGIGVKCKLSNDEADAFFIAKLGYRWWSFYEGRIKESDLTEKEHHIFLEQHTYTKGKKKGKTEKKGVMFRENELYYVYDKLPRPKLTFLGEPNGKETTPV